MNAEILTKNLMSECLKIINNKNIDLNSLASYLGVETKVLKNNFLNPAKDISFYLEAFHILNEWQEI